MEVEQEEEVMEEEITGNQGLNAKYVEGLGMRLGNAIIGTTKRKFQGTSTCADHVSNTRSCL